MTKTVISVAALSFVLLAALCAATFLMPAIPMKESPSPLPEFRHGVAEDTDHLPDIEVEYAHNPYEVLPEDYIFIAPGASKTSLFYNASDLRAIANAPLQDQFLTLLGKCRTGSVIDDGITAENSYTLFFGAFSQPYYVSRDAIIHKEMLKTGEYVNVFYMSNGDIGSEIYNFVCRIFASAYTCSVTQEIASIGDASRPMSRLTVSFDQDETFTQMFLKDEFYPLMIGAEDTSYYCDTLTIATLVFDSFHYGAVLTPSQGTEPFCLFKDAEYALLHLFDSIVAPAASFGKSGYKNDKNTLVFYFCTDGSSADKIFDEIDVLANSGTDAALGKDFPELAYIMLQHGKPVLCFSENSLKMPPITANYNYWYE